MAREAGRIGGDQEVRGPGGGTGGQQEVVSVEGGLDISPWQGFNFVMLGGHDIGDSDAWIIESDISMWFLLASQHPFNVFIAPVHDFQNDVTSSEIDFRVVAMQTPDWILLLGAGGQIYGGGFISGLAGEGGPIVGVTALSAPGRLCRRGTSAVPGFNRVPSNNT